MVRLICLICKPKAWELRAYISGESFINACVIDITVCNTSCKADSLNANTNLILGFVLYACLKDFIMVRKIECYSDIRKINRQSYKQMCYHIILSIVPWRIVLMYVKQLANKMKISIFCQGFLTNTWSFDWLKHCGVILW